MGGAFDVSRASNLWFLTSTYFYLLPLNLVSVFLCILNGCFLVQISGFVFPRFRVASFVD